VAAIISGLGARSTGLKGIGEGTSLSGATPSQSGLDSQQSLHVGEGFLLFRIASVAILRLGDVREGELHDPL
jgi:hypothetical protein